MAKPQSRNSFRELVSRLGLPAGPDAHTHEEELDALITVINERQNQTDSPSMFKPDAILNLRELTVNELIPTFVELVEKYSERGMSMHMDASDLLEGGRGIKFEFGIGEHRACLDGTVTNDSIAFHETRYAPDLLGELVSGPMLRLRGLDRKVFRNFICGRLTVLLRTATRRY